MLISVVSLIGGLILILGGANFLTDGSSAVARRMGLSDLVVGLTIVAFGTSTPELVISVMSSANGLPGIAVGNVVGSNLFNTLVIIGLTAIVRPIKIGRSILTNDIPLVVLSALVLLIMGNGVLLDGDSADVITRVDGLILICFFMVFMRYTFHQAKAAPEPMALSDPTAQAVAAGAKRLPMWRSIAYVVGGLAALVMGGDLFVDGASAIASGMGVSEAVIGLTIVAAGTSLPELAASLVAAVKGHSDMALGNVIGSNIFNIFLVLGCAATVTPLPLGGIGNFDLLWLLGASALFWLSGRFVAQRMITRMEGALLALCYVAYTAILISSL